MKPPIRNLVALALAGFAVLIAGTYEPFGGTKPGTPRRVIDPKRSGFEAGLDCGLKLAMEDVQRFKTPERIAQYLATKHDVSKDVRDLWRAEFVKGFEVGMRERLATKK